MNWPDTRVGSNPPVAPCTALAGPPAPRGTPADHPRRRRRRRRRHLLLLQRLLRHHLLNLGRGACAPRDGRDTRRRGRRERRSDDAHRRLRETPRPAQGAGHSVRAESLAHRRARFFPCAREPRRRTRPHALHDTRPVPKGRACIVGSSSPASRTSSASAMRASSAAAAVSSSSTASPEVSRTSRMASMSAFHVLGGAGWFGSMPGGLRDRGRDRGRDRRGQVIGTSAGEVERRTSIARGGGSVSSFSGWPPRGAVRGRAWTTRARAHRL